MPKSSLGRTLRVRHYGSSKFEMEKFNPIVNSNFIKPTGGLWTSPVDSRHSWHDWCMQEGFRLERLKEFFDLEIWGNILTIHTKKDLDCMRWKPNWLGVGNIPDFEYARELGVDAIHLTEFGERETRFPDKNSQNNLYGWDCETVLILNTRCILGIKRETDGLVGYEAVEYSPIGSLEL